MGSGNPELENRVKSNCDIIANFSFLFRYLEFLIKIKFLSFVTQKLYRYTKHGNLNFIKNSELRNLKILFKRKILFKTQNY